MHTIAEIADTAYDEHRMRRERLARARHELQNHGIAAALLFDPINIRYTTTSGNSAVANLHYSFRWTLVPVESEPILWEYNDMIPGIQSSWPEGDIRPASDWHFYYAGANDKRHAQAFAEEIASELKLRGIRKELIGIDRLEAVAFLALQDAGLRIVDAQRPLELARAVKTPDEIAAMRVSARVCDAAIEELRLAMKPGITENQLWGTFAGAALMLGAEYVETRLLTSGPRTNPWIYEASDRVIKNGDLVAFDTDLAGPRGYFIDISRTYLCGDKRPSAEQRRLYAAAYDLIQSNVPELRPGVAFEELGEKLSSRVSEEFRAQRYPFIAHGSGLFDEYPGIQYADDPDDSDRAGPVGARNYPGSIQSNMVLSVEAYIGAVGGKEGVKLEEQILITDDGHEVFSRAPYDEKLL